MAMLAGRYKEGVGVKQSNKKAIELLEMAAKRGDAGAQFNLGQCYREGSLGLKLNFQDCLTSPKSFCVVSCPCLY